MELNSQQLLATSLNLPTVIYTFLLAVCLGYWLISLVGLVSVDTVDFDMDVDAELGGGSTALVSLVSFHNLKQVPLTIGVTLVSLFGWAFCQAAVALTVGLPLAEWLLETLIFLLASYGALWTSNLISVPLVPLFSSPEAARQQDLVGKLVEVRTGVVTSEFGQAHAENGGAGLLVQVRCSPGKLLRGNRALVISHDSEADTYEVEPIDDILFPRDP